MGKEKLQKLTEELSNYVYSELPKGTLADIVILDIQETIKARVALFAKIAEKLLNKQ